MDAMVWPCSRENKTATESSANPAAETIKAEEAPAGLGKRHLMVGGQQVEQRCRDFLDVLCFRRGETFDGASEPRICLNAPDRWDSDVGS
jgi:hypothetical protein